MAAKILEIGRSILKVSARTSKEDTSGVTDAKTAQDAVKWIQKAFALIEKMEDTASPGMAELKVCYALPVCHEARLIFIFANVKRTTLRSQGQRISPYLVAPCNEH